MQIDKEAHFIWVQQVPEAPWGDIGQSHVVAPDGNDREETDFY